MLGFEEIEVSRATVATVLVLAPASAKDASFAVLISALLHGMKLIDVRETQVYGRWFRWLFFSSF